MKSDRERLDEQFPLLIESTVQSVATFIPSRQPVFKVHTTAGLAHSALGNKGFTDAKAKYELGDKGWTRVWAYVPPENCRRCNRKFDDVLAEQRRQNPNANYWRFSRYHDDPTYTGPRWCAEPVCKICVEQIRQEQAEAEQEAAARAVHEQFFTN